MADSLGYSIFLEPKDAVRAWEARQGLQPTVSWREMLHEQHAVAFTIAKIAKLDLLRMMQKSLDDVIRNGGTFEKWQANVLPELQKAGWWGAVTNRDLTGTDQTIIVNERRLRTIYDTNVRMSMASGNWTKIQREKERFPYLRYLPSSSERKRPLHMEWYGVLLRVDHPWWQTHFPPNGWFCKCHFEQVSDLMMRRKGWSITPDGQIPDGPPVHFDPTTGSTRTSSDGKLQGAEIIVPAGIDPGFGYNPGTAHLRVVADKASRSIAQALGDGLYDPARQTVTALVHDPAFDQFLAIPAAPFPVGILPLGDLERINVQTAMVRLSRQTMDKQSAHHDDLTPDQYRQLPTVIQSGIVERESETRLRYFWRDALGKWWRAAIKRTLDKHELYVASFHRLNAKEGARLDRRYGDRGDAR